MPHFVPRAALTIYELTQNAQLWPHTICAHSAPAAYVIYPIVSDLGELSGNGIEFIDGMMFLECFYTVYDMGISRVSLATTQSTYANNT
ncbi:hypothetical protein WOLCODRAFT_84319 [Wolfiporia cocos MD-104 SS10]|uniref:Uncharacterized protein n=1 Tax=Wolfiporia cocos (strain MD-104) TaxID=742152 RepID=A0A2H3JL48_WOLCO|nr:hypothetical protein WOLCODRAFT_84319 [Wolfiporia cocos MD-104 SS10]